MQLLLLGGKKILITEARKIQPLSKTDYDQAMIETSQLLENAARAWWMDISMGYMQVVRILV